MIRKKALTKNIDIRYLVSSNQRRFNLEPKEKVTFVRRRTNNDSSSSETIDFTFEMAVIPRCVYIADFELELTPKFAPPRTCFSSRPLCEFWAEHRSSQTCSNIVHRFRLLLLSDLLVGWPYRSWILLLVTVTQWWILPNPSLNSVRGIMILSLG